MVTREAAQAPDSETESEIIVTQETNGLAIWRSTYESGHELVKFVQYCLDPFEAEISKGAVWHRLRQRSNVLTEAVAIAQSDQRKFARQAKQKLIAQEAAKS